MKKIMFCLLALVSLLIVFCSCECKHKECSVATCSQPSICLKCGEEVGQTLAHKWDEATCTTPKTCSTCNTTSGNALGHSWIDATCTSPKTCSTCNTTSGNTLGHSWIDATCTSPKTCANCKITSGAINPTAHVGATECSLCHTNYRNTLIDYILMYGTQKRGSSSSGDYWILYENVYTSDKTFELSLEYHPKADWLVCTLSEAYNSKSFYLSLELATSSLKCDYKYVDAFDPFVTDDFVSGQIITANITNSTNTLPFENATCQDGYHSQEILARKCATYLKHLLTAFDKVCKNKNLNITAKDFGFVNF